MKMLKQLLLPFMLAIAVLSFVSCDNGSGNEDTPSSPTPDETVTTYTWVVDSATALSIDMDEGTYTINAKTDNTFVSYLGETAVASGTWTCSNSILLATINKEINQTGTALESVESYTLQFTIGQNNVITLKTDDNGYTNDATLCTWVVDADLSQLLCQCEALPDLEEGTYTFEIRELNSSVSIFDLYKGNAVSLTPYMSGTISPDEDNTEVHNFWISTSNGGYEKPLSFTTDSNNVLTFIKPKFDVVILFEDFRSEEQVIKVALGEKIPQSEIKNPDTWWYFDEDTKDDNNIKYTFAYWFGNTHQGSGDTDGTEFDFDTIITGDYALHAKWIETEYNSVSVNADWCTTFVSTDTNAGGLVAEGATVTFTVTPPENQTLSEGYPKVETYAGDVLSITQDESDNTKWSFVMPKHSVSICVELINS